MNIALAITAVRQGATVANHVRVTSLVKDEEGKITAVSMKDVLTGKKN
jgi:glycerol-3-phosphate dehydrogenase